MPLEKVSEIRSRQVMGRGGKAKCRKYADYKCSYCGSVSEKLEQHAKRDESCGCQQKRLRSESNTRHGMTGSSVYKSWISMIQRCTNPQYPHFKNYGGRGISVCDRWLNSFDFFLEDMGERPVGRSLDRIDNSRGYEPGNCRWTDPKTQGRNKRNNHILTINGVSRCLSEWAEQPDAAKYTTIQTRLRLGWPDREAVFGKNRRNGEAKDGCVL